MRHTTFLAAAAIAAPLLGLAGCQDAPYDALRGQAYIEATGTKGNTAVGLTVGDGDVSADVTVRLSDPAGADMQFRIVVDTAAISLYNAVNQTSLAPLPETEYSLSAQTTTVRQGQSLSDAIRLDIPDLSEAVKATGKKYAIGLRLEAAGGGAQVLAPGSTIVYQLNQAPVQSVPRVTKISDTAGDGVTVTFAKPQSFTEYTLEMNVLKEWSGEGLGNNGNGQNRSFFWTNGGPEVFLRFGDAPIDGRILQLKTRGTQANSTTQFGANTWYHIAWVCTADRLTLYVNGQEDVSATVEGQEHNGVTGVYLGPAGWWSNGQYGRFAEMRFWGVARTQSQIQANMYSVDPQTPGLLSYLKLNEGTSDIKDSSPLGNNVAVKGFSTWIEKVRIDGK